MNPWLKRGLIAGAVVIAIVVAANLSREDNERYCLALVASGGYGANLPGHDRRGALDRCARLIFLNDSPAKQDAWKSYVHNLEARCSQWTENKYLLGHCQAKKMKEDRDAGIGY